MDRPEAGKANVLGQQPLQRVLDELNEATTTVKRYVDQHVAHLQRDPEPVALTYAEVDEAIDHVATTLRTLKLFLEQSALVAVVPTVQGDWKSPFRAPLIDCDDNPVPWEDPGFPFERDKEGNPMLPKGAATSD